jgi:diguanylate cyclase (GGDEF)-like protein
MPDAPRLSTALLGSGFGRRLFIMFCLAALVPAVIVFWMTYRTATSDAEAARQRALREGGKDFALGVYGRLQLAEAALATADVDAVARGEHEPFLTLYFSDVSVAAQPHLRSGAKSHVYPASPPDTRGGRVSLHVAQERDGVALRLVRATGSRALVGTLDPVFLWGDPDDMGQDMRICMFAGRERLFCGGHPGAVRGDRLLAARWDLFLKAKFAAEPWTVVSVAGAGPGLRHYSGVLAPAAAGVLLFALLLSSMQIRRVLVPLSELLRRIRGFEGMGTVIARQAGEDEFGLLSRTFYEMQHRIEERKQRLVFQARHDPLTQLPNRLATFEAVAAAIADAERSGCRFAVAFLDLDRFKSINDALGHAFGDELLVSVGLRIREGLSPSDFVGRFGGDEFCLILANAGDAQAVESAMQRVVDAFSQPVKAGGREFLQRFSTGVAFYPDHGQDASTLIRNADVAMYHGKRAGGRVLRLFVPEMNSAAQSRLRMESDLRHAIAAGAIDVHYQPRIDSRNGRIMGAEALARWTHPETGPIAPSTFIALAEDTGLIDDLGELVLRTACRQLAALKASGLLLPLVAVNVSSHQLRSRQLVATLRAAIDSAGIDPSELEVEITETMLVRDSEGGEHQLQCIRDLGVTIAIDDFGTGYSSLSYLAELPFDTLKIDRSFVLGIKDGNTAMAAIVRATIGLARELGKNVIAEGVESMAEVDLLANWGCHTIQGYVYHRPLDASALGKLLPIAPRT